MIMLDWRVEKERLREEFLLDTRVETSLKEAINLQLL